MLKLVLTAVGFLLLFASALLVAERRKRWVLAGTFAVLAAVCLAIGKGTPWLVMAALAGAGAAYMLLVYNPSPKVK